LKLVDFLRFDTMIRSDRRTAHRKVMDRLRQLARNDSLNLMIPIVRFM
jgi:hypothetical protein